MTRIVLDADLQRKLLNLKEPLELCDEKGYVRAQLIPVLDPSEWEPWEPPPLSEEEMERRLQGPGYTTAEVLAYLESLRYSG